MMKKLLLLLWLAPPLAAGELVDRIVAVVGSEVITLSDVKAARHAGHGDPLEALIRERLLELEMEKAEITVTDDDLANALREVLARNRDRKSTRLNSSHSAKSRMPSSA